MTRYAALLRGVNVGGNKKVAMADLRTMLTALGFDDVRTLLQSGNAVFGAATRPPAELEASLTAELERRFGLRSDVMIRTARDLDAAIAANPFPDEAARDAARLVMLFLAGSAKPAAVSALQSAIAGRETVRGSGRHVYAYYPDGQGDSKLTLPKIEAALGTRATARNWNTVLKIAEALRT